MSSKWHLQCSVFTSIQNGCRGVTYFYLILFYDAFDPIMPAKRRWDSASDTTEVGTKENALLDRFVEHLSNEAVIGKLRHVLNPKALTVKLDTLATPISQFSERFDKKGEYRGKTLISRGWSWSNRTLFMKNERRRAALAKKTRQLKKLRIMNDCWTLNGKCWRLQTVLWRISFWRWFNWILNRRR